jgi:hypothetical protein
MRYKVLLLSAFLAIAIISGCGGDAGQHDVTSPRTTSGLKAQSTTTASDIDDDLILPNDRSQYVISSSRNGLHNYVYPDDGKSKTVSVLRRIQFADISVAFDIEHTSQIYRLYQAAFDRTPDLAGTGYWLDVLDKDVPLETIAEDFVGSAEFRSFTAPIPTTHNFSRSYITTCFIGHRIQPDSCTG